MQVEPGLLVRCQKNDRKAHNELYQRCFGYLMAICLRYCNNREDAESLLNLGFLKIISNLDKHRPDVPFNSWMSRVMVNTIIDEFRKDKKRRDNMSETELSDAFTPGSVDFNEAAQRFDAEVLEQMIQQLPKISRTVFNLYAIEGYTHKEIGELLNISDGTSKWHVSSARKSLQSMLKQAMKKTMSISLF
ncbi:MAG: RNA polymerase sigma factor [Salibacteraceae bacterium]